MIDRIADLLHFSCSNIAIAALPTTKLSARLITVLTQNGDVRPIATGECLRRITTRAVCLQANRDFERQFRPIKHEVSTKCGPQLLYQHRIKHRLGDLESGVRNAFNSIDRSHVLYKAPSSFSSISNNVR